MTKTLKETFNVDSLIAMAVQEDKTLVQAIAMTCDTINRLKDRSTFNQSIWTEYLDYLADFLPSGSGFDSGTTINLEKSGLDRVVLETGFHHMSEHGFYLRWTEHTVTVKQDFSGFDLKIGGRDYRGIKEYMGDEFYNLLSTTVADHINPPTAQDYADRLAKAGHDVAVVTIGGEV